MSQGDYAANKISAQETSAQEISERESSVRSTSDVPSTPHVSSGSLAAIFLTITLDLMGFGIILPLMPLHAKNLGASGAGVGLLFASYSIMQFLFSPIWGRLSDRIGRRPVLLGSIFGNALSLLLFAWADQFVWLLIARGAAGMCAANISVAQAYMADVLPPEKRAKGMGMIGAAFGLGFVIGPVVGGELSVWGLGTPFLIAAGLSFVSWLMVLRWLPESLPQSQRARAVKAPSGTMLHRMAGIWHIFQERLAAVQRVSGAGQIVLLVFFQIIAFSMLEMAFVLFASRRLELGATGNGRLFMYLGVWMVIVQGGLIGPLVRRFGEARLATVGLFSIAIGMLLIPETPQRMWPVLLIFMTFVAVGQGLVMPTLTSLLSQRSPMDMQGVLLGASQSASALARVIGPAIAGVLFDAFNENAPFFSGGVLMVASALWAWRILVSKDEAYPRAGVAR